MYLMLAALLTWSLLEPNGPLVGLTGVLFVLLSLRLYGRAQADVTGVKGQGVEVPKC